MDGRPRKNRIGKWLIRKQNCRDDRSKSFFSSLLDPFPYNGTMSTLDAIWMGVPVVTLNGNRWAARASAAIAAEAGLPDLICESEQAYIDKAVALASDTERLNSMKKSLRVILESSPVCDIGKFSTSLQDLYKYAWKAYCLN